MPIIPNRTLKHNKFQYLNIHKRKHDFLQLTYPGLPKWLWEIPPERIRGKYIPFHELYYIGYDTEATEEERSKALLEFVRSKYIHANAEENMTVKEIIDKYKRLAAKGKREGVTADSDEEDGGNDGGGVGGGIHISEPRFVMPHSHTEDVTAPIYMDVGDGDPSTGVGSVGPGIGPEIGTVRGGHGDQPTDTASGMLHDDALAAAAAAQDAALTSALQDIGDMDFDIPSLEVFGNVHNDFFDYSGAQMSHKGDTFSLHVSEPMQHTYADNPDASGREGSTTLGDPADARLNPFIGGFARRDVDSSNIIGDHRNATFFKLQNEKFDLETKIAEQDTQLTVLQSALESKNNDFFFSNSKQK